MSRTLEEATGTISLVLTLDQIQYITTQAAERGVKKAAIGRDLMRKGITVDQATSADGSEAETPASVNDSPTP